MQVTPPRRPCSSPRPPSSASSSMATAAWSRGVTLRVFTPASGYPLPSGELFSEFLPGWSYKIGRPLLPVPRFLRRSRRFPYLHFYIFVIPVGVFRPSPDAGSPLPSRFPPSWARLVAGRAGPSASRLPVWSSQVIPPLDIVSRVRHIFLCIHDRYFSLHSLHLPAPSLPPLGCFSPRPGFLPVSGRLVCRVSVV